MSKALTEYRAKRDFTKTKEPRDGSINRRAKYPRFVIQKHDATRLHYDLRLEIDGVFKSWAVTRGPSLDPNVKRLAVEVEDHPLDYGDFEGTIPKGEYGGGTVMLWDRGFWTPVGIESPAQALLDGELKFIARGEKFNGSWVLVRMKRDRSTGKHTNWLLIKHRDEFAKLGDGERLLAKNKSVASLRTMSQIAGGKGNPPVPFMRGKNKATATDAVWHSRDQDRQNLSKHVERKPHRVPARLKPVKAHGNRVQGVTISNPDKILWPSKDGQKHVTKLDLAEYLATVGPWLMRHSQGRPCSIIRAPDGIAGQQFFQRHAGKGISPLVSSVHARKGHEDYIQIDTIEGLVAMGQIGALEFHPWNCAPDRPTVPGRLIFDLDPAPDVQFPAVVEAAKELRDRLLRVGLIAFCKTTGGKGLHVVTPLKVFHSEQIGWEQAKMFARAVSAQMAADSPSRYLITMTKRLRTGRIFIDYLRNDKTATAVAPLSPRARPGAPVSMPLNWNQVRADLDPLRFTIRSAASLLNKTSVWQGYDVAARPLKVAIEKLVTNR